MQVEGAESGKPEEGANATVRVVQLGAWEGLHAARIALARVDPVRTVPAHTDLVHTVLGQRRSQQQAVEQEEQEEDWAGEQGREERRPEEAAAVPSAGVWLRSLGRHGASAVEEEGARHEGAGAEVPHHPRRHRPEGAAQPGEVAAARLPPRRDGWAQAETSEEQVDEAATSMRHQAQAG